MFSKLKVFTTFHILFLIALQWSDVQAQNYALFNKDKTMTFTQRDKLDIDSAYYFAKIDSIIFDGLDSIYYFNYSLDTINDGTCVAVNGKIGMLGEKMVKKEDVFLTHVFFNNNGDSIFIRKNIADGDTWTMFTWPDGTYVKATVINHFPFSPLPGVPDSIFRIQLNVFTAGGIAVTDSFPNQTKIDLSKDHGLIEFFDFRIFPSPGDSIQYLLRGLTNPDEHKADVYSKNAFDFELGYEFHYREEVAPDLASGADKRISAWKYFVMDIDELESSVTYTMERIIFDTLYNDAVSSANITWDTVEVTFVYADYEFLDTLELNVFEELRFGFSDWIKNDSIYKGVSHKYVYDWFEYDAETGCLSNSDNINMPEQLYGDGLGLMHYMDSTDENEYYIFDMVYFQVGLLEWGVPYDFSNLDLTIQNDQNISTIDVYPNPASENIYLNIDNSDFYTISIITIDGQVIKTFEKNSTNNKIEVPVASLPAGYYLVKLNSSSNIYTGSFIIH